MGKYILRRILYAIPIAFGVSVVCFSLVYIAPGDPLQTVLPPDATAETVAIVKHAYGFDKPLPVQFLIWLGRVVTVGGEEDRHPCRAGRGQDAARRLDDRAEAAADLLARVEPVAGQVDDHHRGPGAEADAAGPAAALVGGPQRLQVRLQWAAEVRRQTEVLRALKKKPVPVAPGVVEGAQSHATLLIRRLRLALEQRRECDRRFLDLPPQVRPVSDEDVQGVRGKRPDAEIVDVQQHA